MTNTHLPLVIELVAGKSENTKNKEYVRETVSAEDYHRELFTEVDTNLSRSGAQVEGITARMGHTKKDRAIQKFLSVKGKHSMFASLDVSHWSPWMSRDFEMRFGNMLLSFFKPPKGVNLGSLFSTLRMVSCHAGYHSAWDCGDGSIQGWCPTIDTFLQSMMVQFAFVDARRQGHFDSEARMNTLIGLV